MTVRNSLFLGFILILISSITGFAQDQNGGLPQGKSLADIAREYREKKQSGNISSSPAASSPADQSLTEKIIAVNQGDMEEQYVRTIRELVKERNFQELEKQAAQVRSTKARFEGGTWKLFTFYQGAAIPFSGRPVSEMESTVHIAILKSWISAIPESVTARVALAESYYDWAWKARGSGYANTVSEQSWEEFGRRIALGKAILVEAGELKQKCPYWFVAMQHVALAEGWDTLHARALLDAAIAFEPDFYHVYREFVYFLLPKWNGEEGEAEAFIEEAANKVGGEQGQFLYFEMASVLYCQCDTDATHMAGMSWPRMKQGYAALEKLYGTSTLKKNRFAYMALLAGDKPAARQMFASIGNDWDSSVWRTKERFHQAQAQAAN
jgi:hypothetical protein